MTHTVNTITYVADHQAELIASLPKGHPARDATVRHDFLSRARKNADKAYAPYSNFHVGATLLTRDGNIYDGANIETRRPEGLRCGEHTAIIQGVADGMAYSSNKVIDLLAVACVDLPAGGSLADGSPCGACRQVINEFSDPDSVVLIDDKKDGVLVRMRDLLPAGFQFGAPQPTNEAAVSLNIIEAAARHDAFGPNLLAQAQKIAENSYAAQTGIREGALVVTTKGRVYGGVQVDNSSTGLGIPALRGAFNRAVFHEGADVRFSRIVVAQIDQGTAGNATLSALMHGPLMDEFANNDTRILLVNPTQQHSFTWGEYQRFFRPSSPGWAM